jgi:hypothetical protein
MARPIEATRPLNDKDWARLEKAMKNVKPLPESIREKDRKALEWFDKIAKYDVFRDRTF